MYSRLPLIVLCSALFTSASYAQGDDGYTVEAFLGYSSSETDGAEGKGFSLQSVFYFSDVNLRNHPYAEAAFLERVSGVGVSLFKSESKSDLSGGSDSAGGRFSVGYHLPDSPVVISAAYTRTESKYGSPLDVTAESAGYDLGLGYYISDGLLVMARYSSQESKINDFDISVDSNGYDVDVKYVSELSGDTAINVQGGYQQSTSDNGTDKSTNTNSSLSSDYYFNRRLSLGGSVALSSGDSLSSEGASYGLNSRFFFNKKLSTAIGVNKFEAKNDQGSDSDFFFLMLSSRF